MTKATKTLNLASGEWATQSRTIAGVTVIEDCDAASLIHTPARVRRFRELTAEEIEMAHMVDAAQEDATSHRGVSGAVVALSVGGYLD